MADYPRLDPNGLLYFWQKLKLVFPAKEDIPTKLSDLTNDTTFQTLAQINALLSTLQTTIEGEIPDSTSDLTNDSDFQNSTQVQTAINAAIAGITGIDFVVVQTLPATGEKGVIYLVSNSGTGQNIYDEYIWLASAEPPRYEKIGTTDVDLSGYVQASEMSTITNAQIDAIMAS